MVLFCTMFLCAVSAGGKLLVDDAGLLSVDDSTAILTKLNEVSDDLNCDLVIMTTAGLCGEDPYYRSRDLFTENGYGRGEDNKDGVMMLISMEVEEGNNVYPIAPFGKCVD